MANSNYIMIESDGFGFGLDVEHNQKYLQGRAAAKVNIDAFQAGRKLLKEEGYEWNDVTLNLSYSQGGHSGMEDVFREIPGEQTHETSTV